MRRQMTDPPFLFWGKEDLIPMRMGKNCTAQQWRKPFTRSSPAPMAELFMHCLPNMEHFREGSGSPAQQPRAFSCTLGSSLLTRKRASAAHKMWIEDSLTVIPLADKASWLHPFDRPSFSAYHAKSKNSVNWKTCSISDLIVLNIASSLQINGNIKSRSNGIPQSLWSS